MDAGIIETRDLTKKYNNQTAVDHLSFNMEDGEIYGFLGPNGAGKTTTLLMLMGLTLPSEGTGTVCGLDILRDIKKIKRLVGYLPENVGFYSDMDAVQSLEYIAELNELDRSVILDKAHEMLELVGLSDQPAIGSSLQNRYSFSMSMGGSVYHRAYGEREYCTYHRCFVPYRNGMSNHGRYGGFTGRRSKKGSQLSHFLDLSHP